MMNRRTFASAAACALALGHAPVARAQAANFPSRPMRLVIPYGPGGILTASPEALSRSPKPQIPAKRGTYNPRPPKLAAVISN